MTTERWPCVTARCLTDDLGLALPDPQVTADPQTRVLDVVKDLKAEGRIKTLIADRGYTFAKPERWAVPLRELGVDTIFDLHRDQRGVQGTFHGALQIDGNLYCPAIPEELKNFERLD